MRPERALRYPSVAVAFTALLIATPAHASYPISMSEYHPSLCQLVPADTVAYTSQLTSAGVVISPPHTPVAGQIAKFVCPVTLTSSIANFYLTNISYTMDLAPLSTGASPPVCFLILDTINGALNVVPYPISNVTGASAGPNLSNYSGISRSYVSCTLTSGGVTLNRYSASVSYF